MRRLAFILATLLIAGIALSDSTPIVRSFPLNYSGAVDVNYPGTPTACWDFESAVGSYTDDCASTYTLSVTGTPVKTADGTWPAGLSGSQGNGWYFDGTNDLLSRSDDGSFEPSGDFSIQCVFTADVTSSTHYVFAKWMPGSNDRSWGLYISAGTVYFGISDDGTGGAGHFSYAGATPTGLTHRPVFVTASYDYISDGGSAGNLYIDNDATASNAAMDGPVADKAAPLTVGVRGDLSSNKFTGNISYCAYYDGIVITEAQHDQMFAQWQGRLSTAGNQVTISSAAPPAIILAPPDSGTEPFLVDQAANSFQVGSPASGSGGLYGASAITNLAQRSSFETWAAGAPSGWTEGITSTGDCAEQTTAVAHGGSSARCTLSDADDAVTLTSACVAVSASTAYYVSAYATLVSGTGLLDINVIEDNNAGCGSPHTTTAVVDDAVPTGDWVKYGGTVTTQGNGDYAQVQISLPAAAAQVLDIDAITLRTGTTASDAYCGADTDASCVANMADNTETVTSIPTAGTWQFEATVRSPIDGAVATPVRQIMFVPATAGNNNKISLKWASDTLTCDVWDSAGTQKTSTVAAAGNADTNYDVKMQKSAAGILTCCWDGTCDATPATGAITDGVGSEIVYGSDGSTGGDVWVEGAKWLRNLR